ncbi:LysR family transcriptional regulator [Streptomyces qinzhouensis]|uniref:LysR family transcriptional regulator n=1 Tax=Streptomyces qinzhouensis TaxID=2599401 RepID=A0A5B8JQZ8_9ACTN|nr:LysR family transcriptional regulator [Streptomyces qinzhouensis]QDY80163.1 LysR family transcriptional regulator [Streptomyces qinzhouensis]
MELRTLEYFVAVAEEGSFTKAAARCHVVQPAISQQIQNLERELGEPLFERRPREVTLTPGGIALLPHARACLEAAAAATRAFVERSQLLGGSLALGTVSGLQGTRFPALLGEYHRRYPEVTIEIVYASTSALLGRVRDGSLDAAVIAGGLDAPPDGVRARTLLHDSIVAVRPLSAPGPDRPLRLEDAVREPLITFGPESGIHPIIRDAFAAHGLPFRPAHLIDQIPFQIALVAEGVGTALIPRSSPALSGAQDVAVVPLEPAVRLRKICVWRKNPPPNAPLKALLDLWSEHADTPPDPATTP